MGRHNDGRERSAFRVAVDHLPELLTDKAIASLYVGGGVDAGPLRVPACRKRVELAGDMRKQHIRVLVRVGVGGRRFRGSRCSASGRKREAGGRGSSGAHNKFPPINIEHKA